MLTAIGATAATGTAGCSGGPLGGSDDQSDGQGDPETPDIEADPDAPAQLVLLEFDVPETVVYGDEFEVEVVIGNTGGEPTESDAVVDVARFGADFEDGQTVEVNASDLGSGETRSRTVGPLTATAAGEFRVAASDGFATARNDAAAGFDVAPQQAALGDQVNSPGTPRVTVTDITYEQALLYNPSTDRETSLQQTLDDRLIAVPRVTVANSGGEAISVPGGLFVFETGSRITGEKPARPTGETRPPRGDGQSRRAGRGVRRDRDRRRCRRRDSARSAVRRRRNRRRRGGRRRQPRAPELRVGRPDGVVAVQ